MNEEEEYCYIEGSEIMFQAPSNRNYEDLIYNHSLPGQRSFTFFRISVPECENFVLLMGSDSKFYL